MNIYGAIRKAIEEFELVDSLGEEPVDSKEVLEQIRKTWSYLERFVKNIEPEYTNYLNSRLQVTAPEDLLITRDMLSEAKRSYKRLQAEDKDVKSFINRYMGLIDSLLTFNIPEEACEVCQSYLFYYFNEEHKVLIKQCVTCGAQYYGINSSMISFSEQFRDLRPAKRREIESIIKLPL